ncbi:DNA fragmentation factor subunit alpha [Denticeps clupeoides]|uniref:DNA fragmentation factor subunit alpha n=1 Tax=Denticeps clupeoides TaxID=299321 RepID=UPI0010A4DE75|nr:DNA fragmentation factor subunit alpha [Denticeps clupeoides]
MNHWTLIIGSNHNSSEEMTDLKPCKVCRFDRQKSYGVVAHSLDQLKTKGSELLGFCPGSTVSVLLEEDGTVVEDEAYFLCLPSNTKFMLLRDKEMWSPAVRIDGGTAWLRSDSVEADAVDHASAETGAWQCLSSQLKQDLTAIILMSEAELQSLVDVPCSDLASALGFEPKKAQSLQDTLQQVLDRREEQRQSRELLQLYLKTVETERAQASMQESEAVAEETEVDSSSGISSRTLMVLKGKTSPETRLSDQELQMVLNKGVASMARVLGWEVDRASALVMACETELKGRLGKIQALQSINSQAHHVRLSSTTDKDQEQTKRKKAAK